MEPGMGFWTPWITTIIILFSISAYIIIGIFLGRIFYNLAFYRWDWDYADTSTAGLVFGILWPITLIILAVSWFVIRPPVKRLIRLADKITNTD